MLNSARHCLVYDDKRRAAGRYRRSARKVAIGERFPASTGQCQEGNRCAARTLPRGALETKGHIGPPAWVGGPSRCPIRREAPDSIHLVRCDGREPPALPDGSCIQRLASPSETPGQLLSLAHRSPETLVFLLRRERWPGASAVVTLQRPVKLAEIRNDAAEHS